MSVCLLVTIQIVTAIWIVRYTVRHWWDYGVVAALAIVVARPLYDIIGGDVSRYLPERFWSDGADGKDQIIIASIMATISLPVICGAFAWLLATHVWRSIRSQNG